MKKALVTGIASLITVGAIVGFSLKKASDNDNSKEESEGIVLTASTTEPKESETSQTTTTPAAAKPAQETEVSFDKVEKSVNIEGFIYTVDKKDIMDLKEVKIIQEAGIIELYHEFKSGEKINLTPTNVKIVDGAGNEGKDYGCANIMTVGQNLDVSQKNFTIWYEFANDPEIGILRVDITLP